MSLHPRVDDWETAFQQLLDEWARREFAYGSADCACWAAAAVLALTGQDFYAPFRGRYRSAAGSVRALRLYGAGDLPSTLTAALGEPVHRAFAGRGDIVMMQGNAGVCTGREALVFTEDGFETQPLEQCELAWKV